MIGSEKVRRSQKQSRAGVGHIPATRTELSPAAARRIAALPRRGKLATLAPEEQRVIDAIVWLEVLTGAKKCSASLVAALAGLTSPATAIEWFRILDQRRSIAYDGMHLRMNKSGRKFANLLGSTPTLEELHRRVVAGTWGPYARALQSLINRYPESYSRQELATGADIPFESFPFEHSISSLLRQRLIKASPAGMLSASDALFRGPRS
jgi:hypothetical protein